MLKHFVTNTFNKDRFMSVKHIGGKDFLYFKSMDFHEVDLKKQKHHLFSSAVLDIRCFSEACAKSSSKLVINNIYIYKASSLSCS